VVPTTAIQQNAKKENNREGNISKHRNTAESEKETQLAYSSDGTSAVVKLHDYSTSMNTETNWH
jgi:hypothetical protein